MSSASTSADTVLALEAEIASLKVALVKAERENKRLSDQLTVLLNRLFRKKSERLDPNQLRMFMDELLSGSGSTCAAPEAVAEKVGNLLGSPEARAAQQDGFEEVLHILGDTDPPPSRRAAQVVLDLIEKRET